jgi:hypothetical protein
VRTPGRWSVRLGRLALAAAVLVALGGCGDGADDEGGPATIDVEHPASEAGEEPGGCDVTAYLGSEDEPEPVDEAPVGADVEPDAEPCLDTPPDGDH